MNVLLMYNLKCDEMHEFTQNLINQNDEMYKDKLSHLKMITSLTTKSKITVYVIISDNIEEIEEYVKEIKSKDALIYIITGNEDAKHILSCVKITSYIGYIKTDITKQIQKIEKVADKLKVKNVKK